MKPTILLLPVLAITAATLVAEEPLAVVVNKANPVEAVTRAQLQKLILGEQSQWSNGKRVAVALRSPGQSEREVVLRLVCAMNETEFGQHLLHATFGGETFAPKVLASGGSVRATVAAIPGAVGFLRVSDLDTSVKVLRFEGALPADLGYKLKVK